MPCTFAVRLDLLFDQIGLGVREGLGDYDGLVSGLKSGVSVDYDSFGTAHHKSYQHIFRKSQFHHLLPIPSAAFTYVDLAELHLGGVGVVIEGLHYIVLEVNHIQLAGSPRNERTLKGNGNQNYAEDYVEQVNIQQR